jgi:hypothetical protein
MIRMITLWSAMILLVSGCFEKKVKVDYILTDDQLAHLMLDLQLSEVALAEIEGARQDTLKDLFWLRYTEIYKHSKPELEEEVRKLESDPEKMKVIMDRVQVMSDSIR